jgi:hypothetical protein
MHSGVKRLGCTHVPLDDEGLELGESLDEEELELGESLDEEELEELSL